LGLAALAMWYAVYSHLSAFAQWSTYSVMGLAPDSRLALAVEFFIYEAPKVLLLLLVVVFAVGIIRSFFTPHRTHGPCWRAGARP
jgi:uncharacterized membrane protein YraQ (UPF0718 family)